MHHACKAIKSKLRNLYNMYEYINTYAYSTTSFVHFRYRVTPRPISKVHKSCPLPFAVSDAFLYLTIWKNQVNLTLRFANQSQI